MSDQLIAQFHNLSGKTAGEKFKNLNSFEQTLRSFSDKASELGLIIASIRPRDNFEKLLKGKLIDTFKQPEQVVEVLKSDERLFIHQVLRCDWFFGGFDTVDKCGEFVSDVFPHISLKTRLKVIHSFSLCIKDATIAEAFFEAIRSRYTIHQAVPLLLCCRETFVQHIIDTYTGRLNFSTRQLLTMATKYPNFVALYLENRACFSEHHKVLHYLADKNTPLFMKMYEKHTNNIGRFKLGRRATEKVIKTDLAAVVKSAKKYLVIFNQKYYHKYFTKQQFRDFFKALFPDTKMDVSFFLDGGHFHTLLSHLSVEERLRLQLECFREVYGEELLDQMELLSKKLLRDLSPEQRDRCTEAKIAWCEEKEIDGTEWIPYLVTRKSSPKLKKLLREAANLDERIKLLLCLVETCDVNRDMDALADVLKLLVSRYRNDDYNLRSKVFRFVIDTFDLLALTDQHINTLEELFEIFVVNDELRNDLFFNKTPIEKFLHYKLLKNQNIDKQIDNMIRLVSQMYLNAYTKEWNLLSLPPMYEKRCLERFVERIPSFPTLSVSLLIAAMSLEYSFQDWNERHTDDPMSAVNYPWIMSQFKEESATDNEGYKETLQTFLQPDKAAMEVIFPDYEPPIPEIVKDLKYFLQMDPKTLYANINEVMEYVLDKRIVCYKRLFTIWNLLSFLNVNEIVANICTATLNDDSKEQSQRQNSIYVLSYLVDEDSFSRAVAALCPSSDKVDLLGADSKEMMTLRKTIANNFKNINPWHHYDLILKFCKGDYLKLVQGSLVSICCDISELRVVEFLKKLANNPVSVKKHAIRLSCLVMPSAQTIELLSSMWRAEKNTSIREVVYDQVFHFFKTEPLQNRYLLLKLCLETLNIDDKNIFSKMASDADIPLEYKSDYIQLCWNKLHNLHLQGAKTMPFVEQLFECLSSDRIAMLPHEFCDGIVERYVLKPDVPFGNTPLNFCADYLLCSPSLDVLNVRITVVMKQVKVLAGSISAGLPSVAYTFIDIFCSKSCKLRDKFGLFGQLLSRFLAEWKVCVTPVRDFRSYLLLTFTSVYHDTFRGGDFAELGKRLGPTVDHILQEFGPEVLQLVSEILKEFVNQITNEQEDEFKIIEGLLRGDVSDPVCILGALLLPRYVQTASLRQSFIAIVAKLDKKNKTVQIFLKDLHTKSVYESVLYLASRHTKSVYESVLYLASRHTKSDYEFVLYLTSRHTKFDYESVFVFDIEAH
uniref:Uncharacterized protein n=1 Tax=Timema douglasi TaxID=61478 RepID=A0A7R8VPR7_TIMDO|nr:unnamed protein product [Timema douglasi]